MKKLRKLKAQRDLFSCKGMPLTRIFRMALLTVFSLFLSQADVLAKKSNPQQTQTSNRQIVLSNSEGTTGVVSQRSVSISGKVTDISGSPLTGVTVNIKGTVKGTITDAVGNYSISNVSDNATLVFSFVVMKQQEISVSGKTKINVVMVEESIGLDEVVAIGYGSLKKKEISSSVVNVNKESFQKGAVSDPMELLVGKVAGLNIDESSSSPHSSSNIQIRGATSITAGNSPLVVIDGVVGGNMNSIATQESDAAHRNTGWIRNMSFLPYTIKDYLDYTSPNGGWNCTCLAPSFDNSANFYNGAGDEEAKCFLDAPYNDKLGAPYQRFNPKDIRCQNYFSNTSGYYVGQFLKGTMKAKFGTGAVLLGDADRNKQPLIFVDQVGTFQNKGRTLETVMSPRWGETNSGLRFIKYPFFPTAAAIDFREADNVEFRLSEVYYTLAECKLRAGDASGAKALVNQVRVRYFLPSDWTTAKDELSRGFTAYDQDWMLSEWGIEFLDEGRRRRTDLRRFDKFTQGQWWFFGRATEPGISLPAKRDRKYEWFPLPEKALSVNSGLKQNPNY